MNEKIEMLKAQAKELRKIALTMIYEAQSGHPGGAFSAADIVTALYFSEMKGRCFFLFAVKGRDSKF